MSDFSAKEDLKKPRGNSLLTRRVLVSVAGAGLLLGGERVVSQKLNPSGDATARLAALEGQGIPNASEPKTVENPELQKLASRIAVTKDFEKARHEIPEKDYARIMAKFKADTKGGRAEMSLCGTANNTAVVFFARGGENGQPVGVAAYMYKVNGDGDIDLTTGKRAGTNGVGGPEGIALLQLDAETHLGIVTLTRGPAGRTI